MKSLHSLSLIILILISSCTPSNKYKNTPEFHNRYRLISSLTKDQAKRLPVYNDKPMARKRLEYQDREEKQYKTEAPKPIEETKIVEDYQPAKSQKQESESIPENNTLNARWQKTLSKRQQKRHKYAPKSENILSSVSPYIEVENLIHNFEITQTLGVLQQIDPTNIVNHNKDSLLTSSIGPVFGIRFKFTSNIFISPELYYSAYYYNQNYANLMNALEYKLEFKNEYGARLKLGYETDFKLAVYAIAGYGINTFTFSDSAANLSTNYNVSTPLYGLGLGQTIGNWQLNANITFKDIQFAYNQATKVQTYNYKIADTTAGVSIKYFLK